MNLISPNRLVLCVVTCLALAGCDGDPDTDNGQVEVHNHTDQEVSLTYNQEVETCCGIEVVKVTSLLPAGQHRTIFVDSVLFDGDLLVEFVSLFHLYDLDFDIFGFETVHIRPEHFAPPIPVGPG